MRKGEEEEEEEEEEEKAPPKFILEFVHAFRNEGSTKHRHIKVAH
jgi:hypothetical protein